MSLSGGALLHAESMLIVPLIRYANEDDWDVSRSGGALVARVGGEEVVVTPRRGQSMDAGMQVLITAPRTLSPQVVVTPRGGQMVIFDSKRIWHEVRPSSRLRFALTLWVYGVEPLSKIAGEEGARQAEVGLIASKAVGGVARQAEEVDAVVHTSMRASMGVVAGGLLRLERDDHGLCQWVMHESALDGAQDVAVPLQESSPWIGGDTWY